MKSRRDDERLCFPHLVVRLHALLHQVCKVAVLAHVQVPNQCKVQTKLPPPVGKADGKVALLLR